MIIQPSPVRSDEKIEYKFNDEQILATINNDELLFNLQNIETGKQYEPQFPINEVKRNEDGTLEVTVINYHDADASEDERFPDPFEAVNEEFETDTEAIQLDELIIEEPEPEGLSETESQMLAIADLDAQREIDKTENQLAIAVLAETMLGGTF
jgi:hypothetical protein